MGGAKRDVQGSSQPAECRFDPHDGCVLTEACSSALQYLGRGTGLPVWLLREGSWAELVWLAWMDSQMDSQARLVAESAGQVTSA